MSSLFQHTPQNLFHISVGAVLVDKDGRIRVHKRTKEKTPPKYEDALGGLPEMYVLMHESLENNETLEEAVHRGLREEFGASGELSRYLGSIQATIKSPAGYDFEKTTLYFEVFLTEEGERPEDDEAYTELLWMEPNELLTIMHFQGVHAKHP
jgi:ADP-ribose pyrophosphatase YjhB (NUDIX family)